MVLPQRLELSTTAWLPRDFSRGTASGRSFLNQTQENLHTRACGTVCANRQRHLARQPNPANLGSSGSPSPAPAPAPDSLISTPLSNLDMGSMMLLRCTSRAVLHRRRGASASRSLATQVRLYVKPANELRSLLQISPEVQDAIANGKPVVALESTIYTHGALGRELPELLNSVVRRNGAVPATIGVLDGLPTVGLSPEEIDRMVDEGARKISRRDFAYIVGAVSNPTVVLPVPVSS